ncbi:hypothetical protein D3C76_1422670 [compost metagenome]
MEKQICRRRYIIIGQGNFVVKLVASMLQESGRYLDVQLVILDRSRPFFAGNLDLGGSFALSGIVYPLHEQSQSFRVF